MLATTSILIVVFAALVFVIAHNVSATVENIISSEMDETLQSVCGQLEQNERIREAAYKDMTEKNLELTRAVARIIAADPSQLSTEKMIALARDLHIEEIHVTDGNGVLRWGNKPEFYGLNFATNEQNQPFLSIISNPGTELAQDPMPRQSDGALYQYIGVSRRDANGIVQIGVSLDSLPELLSSLDPKVALPSLKIAMEGGVFILDKDGVIIADSLEIYLGQNMKGESWFEKAIDSDSAMFEIEFGMTRAYAKSCSVGDTIVVTYRPYSTMSNYRNTPLLIIVIVGVIGVVLLANLLYMVLTRIVIRPIEDINDGLRVLEHGGRINENLARGREMKHFVSVVNETFDRLDASNQTVMELRTSETDLKTQLAAKERINQLSHDLEYRDRLLLANNRVAGILLSSTVERFDVDLQQCLEILGKASEANRVLLWKQTAPINEGNLSLDVVNEWWDSRFERYKTSQQSHLAYVGTPPEWLFDVISGAVLAGPVRGFAKSLREPLLAQGIKSVFMYPVLINSSFWGLLEYTYYEEEKALDDSEQNLLRSGNLLVINGLTRNQMTLSLIEARREALAGTQAKSNFLSTMSHEIRTPLNAIVGMTTIGLGNRDTDRKDYCFSRIEESTKHLLGVINNVLDISKIEAARIELSPVDFSFEQLFHRAVGVVKHKLDEKHLRFSVYIDRRIPKILVGDDQRLAQVIINLLGNAVKFTPDHGAIGIETRLVARQGEDCTIEISISDTGIGIAPDQLERLFNPFVQANETTARNYGGTGLGLSISKSIVELMDGRIWAESELGKGTTIHFNFKTKPGNANNIDRSDTPDTVLSTRSKKAATTVTHTKETPETIDLSGHVVLIAEDIDINREIVAALLEPTGLTMDFAVDGRQALEMFMKDPLRYEAILMDVQMPGMDGVEATRRIRALDYRAAKRIPIIAMTANVFKEDVERFLQAGMDDHVGKPIDFFELRKKLRTYLRFGV